MMDAVETSILAEKIEKLLEALDLSQRSLVEQLLNDWRDSRFTLKLLQMALDHLPEETYIKDRQCRFLLANKTTADINNVEPDALIGKNDFDIFDPEEAELFSAQEQALMNAREPVHCEPECKFTESGRPHWFRISKYPLIDENGELLGLFGRSQYITAEKQTEIMLRAQSVILEMVASNKPLDWVFERITKLNDQQIGGAVSSIMLLDSAGKAFEKVISAGLPKDYADQLIGVEIGDNRGSCGTACWRKETVIVSDIEADTRWRDYEEFARAYGFRACWSAPIFRPDGSVIGTFAIYLYEVRTPNEFERQLMDMGTWLASLAVENAAATAAVRLAADTDPLTGLLNRGRLHTELQKGIERCQRDGGRFAVAFIDLDDFKKINDKFGHQTGDHVLKTVAGRLGEALPDTCTIARVGGDEFVVLMEIEGDGKDCEELMVAIMERISVPYTPRNAQFSVSGSVGIALFPDHGETVDHLLGNADAAMYTAKARSSRVRLYDPLIDQDARNHEERIAALRAAIDAGEIDLDFQPQFDISGKTIVGFEALARWQSPTLGRLSPAYFIPLAEETGLIVAIGAEVLRLACKRACAWHEETGRAVPVAVNVSAHQFADGTIIRQAKTALAESGLDPQFLELELTETLLTDVATAVQVMEQLKAMGVKTALDDFGTGYSNLSALATIPLDRLKIDRSIIQDIPGNTAASSITTAIIAMGQKLGMQVLAEGVEIEEQMQFLTENGCDCLQGYLLGRPVPFEHAVGFLRRGELDAPESAHRS